MIEPVKNIPDSVRQRNYNEGYNKWHWEKLPKWCYMMDLDSIEIRSGKGIVALIETRTTDTFLNELQHKIILGIANRLNVPAYLVFHDRGCTQFKVTNLRTKESTLMYEDKYLEFIKGL